MSLTKTLFLYFNRKNIIKIAHAILPLHCWNTIINTHTVYLNRFSEYSKKKIQLILLLIIITILIKNLSVKRRKIVGPGDNDDNNPEFSTAPFLLPTQLNKEPSLITGLLERASVVCHFPKR